MRINIVGSSGSGKTTFGRQLAGVLGIPFIEMDALFWRPDWTEPQDEEFFPVLEAALQGDSWVLDGNYSRTTAIKWERVQAVVWLDYSFPRTLYQAVTRAVSRLVDKQELWPGTGNRETLGKLFSRDSIILFTISSFGRKRRRIQAAMESTEFSQIKFHRLRSPAQAAAFLRQAGAHPQILFKDQTANG